MEDLEGTLFSVFEPFTIEGSFVLLLCLLGFGRDADFIMAPWNLTGSNWSTAADELPDRDTSGSSKRFPVLRWVQDPDGSIAALLWYSGICW